MLKRESDERRPAGQGRSGGTEPGLSPCRPAAGPCTCQMKKVSMSAADPCVTERVHIL